MNAKNLEQSNVYNQSKLSILKSHTWQEMLMLCPQCFVHVTLTENVIIQYLIISF